MTRDERALAGLVLLLLVAAVGGLYGFVAHYEPAHSNVIATEESP